MYCPAPCSAPSLLHCKPASGCCATPAHLPPCLPQVQAQHNFTHLIQLHKRPEHTLVTSGVYAWVRHPGYAGWTIWAVGTQLLLCNPLCTLAFAAAAWRFFDRRIRVEERLLASFFGDAWQQYRARVPSGIPGIP